MLANKERMLQKMEEFDLDAIIASHPENVSYLSDFQSHLPYIVSFFKRRELRPFSTKGRY